MVASEDDARIQNNKKIPRRLVDFYIGFLRGRSAADRLIEKMTAAMP
jgi:hypothetical protein